MAIPMDGKGAECCWGSLSTGHGTTLGTGKLFQVFLQHWKLFYSLLSSWARCCLRNPAQEGKLLPDH